MNALSELLRYREPKNALLQGGSYPSPEPEIIDRATFLPIGQYPDGSLTFMLASADPMHDIEKRLDESKHGPSWLAVDPSPTWIDPLDMFRQSDVDPRPWKYPFEGPGKERLLPLREDW